MWRTPNGTLGFIDKNNIPNAGIEYVFHLFSLLYISILMKTFIFELFGQDAPRFEVSLEGAEGASKPGF